MQRLMVAHSRLHLDYRDGRLDRHEGDSIYLEHCMVVSEVNDHVDLA